jgi:hypothetical protein
MTIEKDWEVILIKNLIDTEQFYELPIFSNGQMNYDKQGRFTVKPEEGQVNNSFSRYNYPLYRELHYAVKNVVENIIGEKLYPTYYYDRFYKKGNELKKHTDREACEISVTLNLDHNLDHDWPLWFETQTGEYKESVTKPGDAIVYKGMTVPHWRYPMKGNSNSYYHQIFLHYVRRDGPYLHYAFDNGNNDK